MDTDETVPPGLRAADRIVKRTFDLVVSVVALLLLWWVIVLAFVAATIDTRRNGFFTQRRVGRGERLFSVIKIRTMGTSDVVRTTVTSASDPRITRMGRFLRRAKIDELPQLVNVMLGQMSFVGPRPDVEGFANRLTGADRIILSVRPGITGPATLEFRDEEALLAGQPDPEAYNRDVIWPEKVRLNRAYVERYRFTDDLRYLWVTATGGR